MLWNVSLYMDWWQQMILWLNLGFPPKTLESLMKASAICYA